MAKASCKCKKTECEECPEWIFTFADLVMLMMGFFVILWVLKPPAGKNGSSDAEAAEQQKTWIQTVGEIRKGFGYEPDPHSNDPVDKMMIQKALGQKQGAENNRPRQTAIGTNHEVTTVRPGNYTVVGARLLFDAGSLKLTPETTRALDEIAEKIRGHFAIVLVKGHASLDDLPETATDQQRMDLSLRRAQAAADFLMTKGVAPQVLRVQGCSTFEPVHQRAYSPGGQTDNRRVEIEWTSELVDERADRNNVPTAPLNEKPGTTAAEKAPAPSDGGDQIEPSNAQAPAPE
jgi:chemotaxis protein MotB